VSEESDEQLLDVVERMQREMHSLRRDLAAMRRYLRDEGYGDDDEDSVTSLDDDGD